MYLFAVAADDPSMRRRNVALVVCAFLATAFLVVLIVKPGGAHQTRTIDDLGELAAAVIAAVLPRQKHARRSPDRVLTFP